MTQKQIEINNVITPIIEEGGEAYYPISFMGSKVLLKDLSPGQLKRNGYDNYIKQFNIDYGENYGGLQSAYCISELGLKEILKNCKIARLNVEQKKAMKQVCEYINLDLSIDTEEKFLDTYPELEWNKYDFWIRECIESVLNVEPNIKWQRCSKCGKYYPYIENFFDKEGNPNNKSELRTICKKCKVWSDNRSRLFVQHYNKEFQRIFTKYGENIYLLFKNNNILDIWIWYKSSDYNHLPEVLKNKNNVLYILKYLYDNRIFKDININDTYIEPLLGFKAFNYGLVISDVYKTLFGYDLNSKEGSGIELFDDAKIITKNFVVKNNIEISYNSDLWDLIKNVGLTTYLKKHHNNDILDFILKVFGYTYFAYKFEGGYKKFWENKSNRLIALKQLIEEDMKIPIDKIPLYLTLENIRKQSNTMRYVLKNYYQNNIWIWVNELYPNYFDEEDFNITVIRHVFDSAEESLIHDILTNRFKNVLYNQRNTKTTITLMGMQPDWFIFTNNGVWIVEYFGITNSRAKSNQRIIDYQNKTISKIEKYKELNWLRTIYVYPDDLKDNFNCLNNKLNEIE